MTSFRWPRWRNCSPEPARIGKLTREQLSEMIEQRQRMTAALTLEQVGELQRQRAEQVSRLTPGQLAELHQQRQQLLPDGFPQRD
jgi:hypothetical protein